MSGGHENLLPGAAGARFAPLRCKFCKWHGEPEVRAKSAEGISVDERYGVRLKIAWVKRAGGVHQRETKEQVVLFHNACGRRWWSHHHRIPELPRFKE